jgi:hypothetical protein
MRGALGSLPVQSSFFCAVDKTGGDSRLSGAIDFSSGQRCSAAPASALRANSRKLLPSAPNDLNSAPTSLP